MDLQKVLDDRRNATSAAHTAKVADNKEKERLRCQAKRDKKKAERASALAAAQPPPALPPQGAAVLPSPLVLPIPAPPPQEPAYRS